MEAGERELRKAFEEVTTRNVRAAVDHGNNTRQLFRELEKKMLSFEGILRQYDEKLELLRKQIISLQSKLYRGGS